LRDLLTDIVDYGQKRGSDFMEVRLQTSDETIFHMEDGRVESVKQGIESGFAIRVLVRGSWGFATVNSEDALREATEKAVKMAITTSRHIKEPVTLSETETVEDRVVIKPDVNPKDIHIEEKLKLFFTLNDYVLNYNKAVRSCTIDYADVTGKKWYVNSEGTIIEQDNIYVWSRIVATAREGDVFASSREELGSTKGFGFLIKEHPESIGERVAKRLMNQMKAKTPKGGLFTVVLGPDVTGTFAHEAFGHLAEADLTISGSVLAKNLGMQIASPLVSIYDDGTVEGEFGSFKYDDEGVKAQKTVLLKDGYVVGLMYDREHSSKMQKLKNLMVPTEMVGQFNVKPTGNARAEDFRSPPLIRMRNTYIEPRDYTFEELLEDINFGYYLVSFRGGQANLDGTFQVGIQEAYEIINGELGAPVRNVSISGNTLETLRQVDAVGKDFEMYSGRCGKGQTAFVGDGGPPIRVKNLILGGAD
jgi:TldD protein